MPISKCYVPYITGVVGGVLGVVVFVVVSGGAVWIQIEQNNKKHETIHKPVQICKIIRMIFYIEKTLHNIKYASGWGREISLPLLYYYWPVVLDRLKLEALMY